MDLTRRAEKAIRGSNVIVGYGPYLQNLGGLIRDKEIITSGMTREIERCRTALGLAEAGRMVSLVSSGDAGVYGMAGPVIEMAAAQNSDVAIEIIPGVSASGSASAKLGAPLMLDYAVISLSDLLVPWETIRGRLEAVAAADLVAALYNPKSKKRDWQLAEAAAIFRKYRPGSTPVGVATAVGQAGECIDLTDLDHFENCVITMQSIVIVGNRSSRNIYGWFVTPRGYSL